ncbi:MAG: MlaD family protein [Desulfovibrio sp.]|jgi:phospholipid/cholesterol/gamma-HCH transport system substrate-binding protein|nr:MlaD family protein [Desulfovibrio sp.]
MEIRAKYLAVGMFTLAVFAAAAAFAVWLADKNMGRGTAGYDICFTESVKGLSVNSDVLFVGIRVGRVENITISDVHPGEVRVRIAIDDGTPVREDSRAKLDMRGITGSSIISISGGTARSPILRAAGGKVPEIPAEPSAFSAVVSSVPQVMAKMERLLSDANIAAAGRTIQSLDAVTESLAAQAAAIESLPAKYASAADRLSALIARIDEMLANDLAPGLSTFHSAMRRIDDTMLGVGPGMAQFAGQGLAELRLLTTDLRSLTQAATRAVRKLENDPRRFFFGDQNKEFDNR